MTISEFWHLKYGTIVGYESIIPFCTGKEDWGFKGKVIKREVVDEICGFMITKNSHKDFKTGRKVLVITLDCGNGNYRYLESNTDLKRFKIYPEGTKLKS